MSKHHHHNIDFANWELFVIALSRVGGSSEMVDVETAFVEAHKIAPDRFSWRTMTNIPEIKKLSKALRDADAKAQYMTGSGNRRQLTAVGLDWIKQNSQRIEHLKDPTIRLGLPRSTEGYIMLKRVINSVEFATWKADRNASLERWRLANIFKCSPDSPFQTWISRLEQTGAAAHAEGRDDVRKFMDSLKELFANELS